MKLECWSVGIVLVALLGVRAEDPKQTKVVCHRVVGQVLFDGKPLVQAIITFHSTDPKFPAKLKPSGETLADGTFLITTFKEGDGAPAGEYVVTITWPERDEKDKIKPGTDRLKGRYADVEKSPLRVTITTGMNQLKFELRSK
jgi:hypothetical protein